MRLKLGSEEVHLGYCSNVHPATSFESLLHGLDEYAGPVRNLLDVDQLSVTLWIPHAVAAQIEKSPAHMGALARTLLRNRLEVVSLNGFPCRPHQPGRKYGVFRPDWTEPERLDYTLALVKILAEIMPYDAVSGSVSTLPLYWRTRSDPAMKRKAEAALLRLDDSLRDLEYTTGRTVRVGVEPEPGCVIERVDQAAEFLSRLGLSHVGLCADTCHMAVQYEDPRESLATARRMNVPIVKAQLANGIRASHPRSAAWLARFDEEACMHQTRELREEGVVHGVDDLGTALSGGLPGDGEWRIHYHYPLTHAEHSTQDYLLSAMGALIGDGSPMTRHLEVETYTWRLLPEGVRPHGDDDFVRCLAGELAWARDRLLLLGASAAQPESEV